jgi:hypothetical protein
VTGLHGRAERNPHGVTVYLVPGLTACQRKAVIRRLRQEASRYVGPALPLPQLAVALGLDRVRSAARTAGAVVRLHPAVTLLPTALVAALMTVFVIASADGTALATGQRAGLADGSTSVPANLPGEPQAVTEAVVPGRMAGGGSMGLDSRAIAQPRTQPGTRAVPGYRGAAWCACPPVLIGPAPAPFPGQLACERSASRPAPYTAHRPDPCAFAA